MAWRDRLPFVRRATYEKVRRENWELRGAIRAANAEIQKHRQFMIDVRNGSIDIVGRMDKIREDVAAEKRAKGAA